MGLRLVKRGAAKPAAQDPTGAAFLVVDGRGTVLDALAWETVSASEAPRKVGDKGADDPIARAVGEAVVEARRTGRPATRRIEVSTERARLYAVAAAPLPGERKPGSMAVTVQETGEPQAGAAEGKVIRQLGHDLRTPLTSISGAVELLQTGRLCPVQPPQERILGMMQKGVDAMLKLIEEATAPYRPDVAKDLGIEELAAGLEEES